MNITIILAAFGIILVILFSIIGFKLKRLKKLKRAQENKFIAELFLKTELAIQSFNEIQVSELLKEFEALKDVEWIMLKRVKDQEFSAKFYKLWKKLIDRKYQLRREATIASIKP